MMSESTMFKLYEWQLIALMCAGIVLIGIGLAWVHMGLFVTAVGIVMVVLSMEIDEREPKK